MARGSRPMPPPPPLPTPPTPLLPLPPPGTPPRRIANHLMMFSKVEREIHTHEMKNTGRQCWQNVLCSQMSVRKRKHFHTTQVSHDHRFGRVIKRGMLARFSRFDEKRNNAQKKYTRNTLLLKYNTNLSETFSSRTKTSNPFCRLCPSLSSRCNYV